MTECITCYEPIMGPGVTCKNRSCTAVMCHECMSRYINICQVDNNIPKCPNTTCNRYYLLSDIAHFDNLREPYAKCCFNELLIKHGDNARKTVEIHNNIAQLRTQRQRFVNEQFPAAIAYTARIIMPNKLFRIDKQHKQRLLDQTHKTHRVCMNLTCGGSLDENLRCLSCGTTFCLACEKVWHDYHVCQQEDVETINAIKNMVHCPRCHLPIERGTGCDAMTCAHCGQHFNYNTGEAGGAGNHGQNITIEIHTRTLLSVMHRDILTQMGLLDQINAIEAESPTITNDKALTKVLMDYYRNNLVTSPHLEEVLAREFERHIIRMLINKRYHQALNEIERHIIDRTINATYLNAIRDILHQPI